MSGKAVGVGLVWLGLVGGGFAVLYAHQFTPGGAGPAPASQPAADRPTVVLVLHPECPCAPATVRTLAEVLDRHPARVTVYVTAADPAVTTNGRRAATLPGAEVVADPDGTAAARYGARTSGHVVVYDAAGVLRFAGGVTAGRGHLGPNPGRDAVTAHLTGRSGAATAPVFGCPLAAD